ncbi:leucyl aminopeptidase [Quadrisphaera oryzae]|uniref:leucyl aminopeptidase n=1 Tax=Quadrisphaera TaxID=317661 RepID=UPI0016481DCE|nr:leucyl aminopeptidase [Quadrisphaera sp. RL12-1S]
MTDLQASTTAPARAKADALVIAVAPGPQVLGAEALPRPLRASLSPEALTALGVSGKADEVVRLPAGESVRAGVVVLTGTGPLPGGEVTAEQLRRAAGAATRSLAGVGSAALALPADDVESAAAVAEGALLGAYAYRAQRARTAEGSKAPVASLELLTPLARDKGLGARLRRAAVLADAVYSVRDLVNAPPNELYPETFAAFARDAVKGTGAGITVLDEESLAAGGYGGILGVGQGSERPPRLVRVEHAPRRPTAHLALVGKGITFDSGGLSLKPPTGMVTMKCDMAGAAAVLAAVVAAARLDLPVRVTGWLALAENMPSGTAQRPSDVLTTYGGRTVEVLNTDAEGRLVMADALVAAGEEQPDALVDVATLTGAQVVALGSRVSAVMGDDALRASVLAAAERAGEQFWPMPLPEELRASLDSPVADIANIGDRNGGMLVAGLFLREFVPDGADGERIPWAHLDIAGPAFNEHGPHGYTGKGGTGHAVRTLVALAEDLGAR